MRATDNNGNKWGVGKGAITFIVRMACGVVVWVMDLTLLEEQGWHTEEVWRKKKCAR